MPQLQPQDVEASGSPSPGVMLAPGWKPGWDAGVLTQAWPVRSIWHGGCRELHITEQQEGDREPCRSEMPWDWKAGEEEEGVTPVTFFGVTGNKYTRRVPRLHRNRLSSPDLFCSTRQISRKDICQRGEFNRLENSWL